MNDQEIKGLYHGWPQGSAPGGSQVYICPPTFFKPDHAFVPAPVSEICQNCGRPHDTRDDRIFQLEQQLAAKESVIAELHQDRDALTRDLMGTRERAVKLVAAKNAEIDQLKKDAASSDEMCEAQAAKFEKCPHMAPIGTDRALCAYSYDQPSDVCALHAPQLAKAQAENADLRRENSARQALAKAFREYHYSNLGHSYFPRTLSEAVFIVEHHEGPEEGMDGRPADPA